MSLTELIGMMCLPEQCENIYTVCVWRNSNNVQYVLELLHNSWKLRQSILIEIFTLDFQDNYFKGFTAVSYGIKESRRDILTICHSFW